MLIIPIYNLYLKSYPNLSYSDRIQSDSPCKLATGSRNSKRCPAAIEFDTSCTKETKNRLEFEGATLYNDLGMRPNAPVSNCMNPIRFSFNF